MTGGNTSFYIRVHFGVLMEEVPILLKCTFYFLLYYFFFVIKSRPILSFTKKIPRGTCPHLEYCRKNQCIFVEEDFNTFIPG